MDGIVKVLPMTVVEISDLRKPFTLSIGGNDANFELQVVDDKVGIVSCLVEYKGETARYFDRNARGIHRDIPFKDIDHADLDVEFDGQRTDEVFSFYRKDKNYLNVVFGNLSVLVTYIDTDENARYVLSMIAKCLSEYPMYMLDNVLYSNVVLKFCEDMFQTIPDVNNFMLSIMGNFVKFKTYFYEGRTTVEVVNPVTGDIDWATCDYVGIDSNGLEHLHVKGKRGNDKFETGLVYEEDIYRNVKNPFGGIKVLNAELGHPSSVFLYACRDGIKIMHKSLESDELGNVLHSVLLLLVHMIHYWRIGYRTAGSFGMPDGKDEYYEYDGDGNRV